MAKISRTILSRYIAAMTTAVVIAVLFVSGHALARPYGSGSYGTCAYSSGCSISVASAGNVNLDSVPTEAGVYTVQKDDVIITTDDPVGYSLTLESDSPESAALVKGSDSIAASGGTPTSPAVLAMNTWGYRVDDVSNFGAGPTLAVTNAATNSGVFAGVPLGGSPQQIYSSDTAAPSGDTIPVWYGLAVNNTQPNGTYQRTVVYTATATP